MRRRADKLHSAENGQSAQKYIYGDSWTLIHGISVGMNRMFAEMELEVGAPGEGDINRSISGDELWQEHYDKYGSGAYGRGLEIGKRLAFFEDRGFDISDNPDASSQKETDESPNFTTRSYDDEK